MIHGLRNDRSGALAKYVIAQKRLKTLHYKHPVIGYSYDSNTAGVQYKSTAISALKTGIVIAKKNGSNLSRFILDMKAKNPKNKGIIESVHLFGASIHANSFNPRKSGSMFQKIINKKITNYFSPYDDVLKAANDECWVDSPLGYNGTVGTSISKYTQKKVIPKNHRFASYAQTIKSFP